MRLFAEAEPARALPELLFTENETNAERLFGVAEPASPYVKDAFHEYVVHGRADAVDPARDRHEGGGALPAATSPPGARSRVRLRLRAEAEGAGRALRRRASTRSSRSAQAEADAFYAARLPRELSKEEQPRRAPGLRGAALVEAVLPLRR